MSKKKQIVEYIIRMNKKHSDELIRMSKAQNQDDELVYLEESVILFIEQKHLAVVL